MKRHPFTLLEVLIAIALVSLCIIPLMAPQIHLLRAQKEVSTLLELDPTEREVFSRIVKQLYMHEIPWDTIINEKQVEIPSDWLPQGIEGCYIFEKKLQKPKKPKESDKRVHYLFKLNIFLKQKKDSGFKEYKRLLKVIRDDTEE